MSTIFLIFILTKKKEPVKLQALIFKKGVHTLILHNEGFTLQGIYIVHYYFSINLQKSQLLLII